MNMPARFLLSKPALPAWLAAPRWVGGLLTLVLTGGSALAQSPAQALSPSANPGVASGSTPAPAVAAPTASQAEGSAASSGLVAQGKGRVQLNFANADLEAVARMVMGMTKPRHTLLVDPKVKGQISLQSERAVSHEEAWGLLVKALRLRGVAVIASGEVVQLVPEIDAKLQGGAATVINGTAAPRDGQVGTRIFTLTHESAANLVPILRPLISANNTINLNPGTNTLVVTDYSDNLNRLARIIASLDVPRAVEPAVVPLKHAVASDVVNLVTRLLADNSRANPGSTGTPASGEAPLRTSVIADPRSNAVVIRAPNSAQLEQTKALVNQLDQPNGLAGSGNLHVVYLKNAEANKLAVTLRAAIAAQASASGTLSNTPTMTTGVTALPASTGQTPTPAGAGTASTGGLIQADPATNALIITAPMPLYRQLRSVIDQLDQRRAQVLVESLIVEVNAEKALEMGIQWQAPLGSSGVGGTNFGTTAGNIASLSRGGKTAADAGVATGLNIGTVRNVNGTNVLNSFAHFLETNGEANILSTPTLLTLDNEEAKIVVGQNVPFITGSFSNTGVATAVANPFQTIERKDVGLTLRVKPQISEAGTVNLKIYQEVSNVTSIDERSGPTTNKRSIESNVIVDDGAIVVLGGLLSDSAETKTSQVPGFGDIPGLGWLFKSEARTRKKNNLMVFLRPVVVRDTNETNALSVSRYDMIRSTQQNLLTNSVLMGPGPTAPNANLPKQEPLINMQPANK